MQVRAGQEVSNAEITRFARLFNDELTLEHMESVQVRRARGRFCLGRGLVRGEGRAAAYAERAGEAEVPRAARVLQHCCAPRVLACVRGLGSGPHLR